MVQEGGGGGGGGVGGGGGGGGGGRGGRGSGAGARPSSAPKSSGKKSQPLAASYNSSNGERLSSSEVGTRGTTGRRHGSRQSSSPRIKKILRRTKHEQRARDYRNVPISEGGGVNGDTSIIVSTSSNQLKGPAPMPSSRNTRVETRERKSNVVNALRSQENRPSLLAQVVEGIVPLSKLDAAGAKVRVHTERLQSDEKRLGERLRLEQVDKVDVKLMEWMRTLHVAGMYDLTTTTDHWRRDFANGYVVAEIMCYYCGGDGGGTFQQQKNKNKKTTEQQLHLRSFRNGQSKNIKRENWMRIITYFHNHGIKINLNIIAMISKAKGKHSIRPILLLLYDFFVLQRGGGKHQENKGKKEEKEEKEEKNRKRPAAQQQAQQQAQVMVYPPTIGAVEKKSTYTQRPPPLNVDGLHHQQMQQQQQQQQHMYHQQFASPTAALKPIRELEEEEGEYGHVGESGMPSRRRSSLEESQRNLVVHQHVEREKQLERKEKEKKMEQERFVRRYIYLFFLLTFSLT